MNSSLPLSADPASVPRARRFMVEVLADGGADGGWVDAAVLLASELATNAVLHARTPFTLRVELSDELARVEVEDANPAMPSIRHFSPTVSTGRGLRMVGSLATRWGVTPRAEGAPGKVIWFELDLQAELVATETVALAFQEAAWLESIEAL
jgi:anti-sigma regulatory factor (Ser/Thr protein kinase)